MNAGVVGIDSNRPFKSAMPKYRKRSWFGTIPLPEREKHPPPTGSTGRNANHPDKDQLLEWVNDPDYRKANIGIRLAGVTAEHEIVGIDVDHYISGGKEKKGGDQLKQLVNSLGPLPDTWVSSARTDGISGIRYYRVPRGYRFRGKADKDIDIISKGYRFAVVWPSIHPEGGRYWWFPPGTMPDEQGRTVWDGATLPDATSLPELPNEWFRFLTQDQMRDDDNRPADMESSIDEIQAWAKDNFNDGSKERICARVQRSIEQQKEKINNSPSSHDKLTEMHWHFFRLAAEGHTGWKAAMDEMENYYATDVSDRDKRSLGEVRSEIFRSWSLALRKIKAHVEANISIGAQGVPMPCDASGICGSAALSSAQTPPGPPDDGTGDIPRGSFKSVPEYRMNDDGNGDHFHDTFSSLEHGSAAKWVEGYGWIVWHNGENPHWELDPNGDGIMRRMWTYIRDRQESYVEALEADVNNQIAQFLAQNPGQGLPAVIKALQVRLSKWKKFAEESGQNRRAENAIRNVKRFADARLDINALDTNPLTLGVGNGVLYLTPNKAVLDKARQSDYITLNTGVDWIEHPDDLGEYGKKLWNDYLEKFLPDEAYRRDIQIILGHALLGGNPHKKLFVFKGAPNTGKSVLATMLVECMGDYAKFANKSLYQYHKLNPILAAALPKRVVVTSEMSSDKKSGLTVDQIKTITGGSDIVEAELKGSNVTIARIPFFTPIIVTNEAPWVENADKALRERIRVIDFEVVEEYPDDTIAARMRAESKEAFFHWLVEGYNMYCRNERRLPENEQMRISTDEFTSEFDEVSTFAYERLVKHRHANRVDLSWKDMPDWCIQSTALYQEFNRWWNENEFANSQKPSQVAFTRRLKALGFNAKQIRGTAGNAKYWTGVQLAKVNSSNTRSLKPGISRNVSD